MLREADAPKRAYDDEDFMAGRTRRQKRRVLDGETRIFQSLGEKNR